MASGLYCKTFESALEGAISLNLSDTTADRFKCMLVTSSYTPDFDTHDHKADVTNEVSGTGYSAGGASLTSVTFTISSGSLVWDAADVSWTESTITSAAAAVIYDDTLTNDPLIAYIDFGGSFSTTSGTFQIQWNASGIFTLDLTP